MTTAIQSKLSRCVSAAVLLCAACGGPGNTGRTTPGEELFNGEPLVQQLPWVNGAVPVLDTTQDPTVVMTAPLPIYPPIGQNLPDPGSAPIDCSVLAPYDLAPWVATADPLDVANEVGADPTTLTGIAARWAGADDMTRGSWRTPGFTTWYPDLVSQNLLSPIVWGTPAEAVLPGQVVPACDGQPNNWVIHMRGSGFRYYGGNIAHILAGDNYPITDPLAAGGPLGGPVGHCPLGSDLCAGANLDANTNSAGFPLVPTKNQTGAPGWELKALHTYWDASAYDGVAFWARRGPESMGTLLVTINEKHTSDDMNRQNETYCRRIYACHSTCQNYQPCSMVTDEQNVPDEFDNNGAPLYRCYDHALGALPKPATGSATAGAADDERDAIYPRCGPSACTFRSTYPDADFEGKECRPHTFTSGESAEYCFNADDPLPPSRFERCGDGFTNMLQLTTDWVFYTVPFSSMRQGGYGKVAPEFDLKSVYSLTLGWGPGNMDIFIDNVSLYRAKKL